MYSSIEYGKTSVVYRPDSLGSKSRSSHGNRDQRSTRSLHSAHSNTFSNQSSHSRDNISLNSHENIISGSNEAKSTPVSEIKPTDNRSVSIQTKVVDWSPEYKIQSSQHILNTERCPVANVRDVHHEIDSKNLTLSSSMTQADNTPIEEGNHSPKSVFKDTRDFSAILKRKTIEKSSQKRHNPSQVSPKCVRQDSTFPKLNQKKPIILTSRRNLTISETIDKESLDRVYNIETFPSDVAVFHANVEEKRKIFSSNPFLEYKETKSVPAPVSPMIQSPLSSQHSVMHRFNSTHSAHSVKFEDKPDDSKDSLIAMNKAPSKLKRQRSEKISKSRATSIFFSKGSVSMNPDHDDESTGEKINWTHRRLSSMPSYKGMIDKRIESPNYELESAKSLSRGNTDNSLMDNEMAHSPSKDEIIEDTAMNRYRSMRPKSATSWRESSKQLLRNMTLSITDSKEILASPKTVDNKSNNFDAKELSTAEMTFNAVYSSLIDKSRTNISKSSSQTTKSESKGQFFDDIDKNEDNKLVRSKSGPNPVDSTKTIKSSSSSNVVSVFQVDPCDPWTVWKERKTNQKSEPIIPPLDITNISKPLPGRLDHATSSNSEHLYTMIQDNMIESGSDSDESVHLKENALSKLDEGQIDKEDVDDGNNTIWSMASDIREAIGEWEINDNDDDSIITQTLRLYPKRSGKMSPIRSYGTDRLLFDCFRDE